MKRTSINTSVIDVKEFISLGMYVCVAYCDLKQNYVHYFQVDVSCISCCILHVCIQCSFNRKLLFKTCDTVFVSCHYSANRRCSYTR